MMSLVSRGGTRARRDLPSLDELGGVLRQRCRRRWCDIRPLLTLWLGWFGRVNPLPVRRFRLDDAIPAHGPSDIAQRYYATASTRMMQVGSDSGEKGFDARAQRRRQDCNRQRFGGL